jgi:hypothetical protein
MGDAVMEIGTERDRDRVDQPRRVDRQVNGATQRRRPEPGEIHCGKRRGSTARRPGRDDFPFGPGVDRAGDGGVQQRLEINAVEVSPVS